MTLTQLEACSGLRVVTNIAAMMLARDALSNYSPLLVVYHQLGRLAWNYSWKLTELILAICRLRF